MENKYLVVGLIIGIILVGGYLFSNGSGGATISAVGESLLEVEPDIVSMYVNIEARNESAEIAKAEHDKIIDEVMVGLIRAGFDRDEIKTENYQIYQEYDWNEGERKETGFVVRQSLVVKTEDFSLVVKGVDEVIKAEGLVSWINFELSDELQKEYKVKALEEAGKDAKVKAEATARGLGKSLGRIVSVQGEDFYYQPYRYLEATADSGVGIAFAEVQKASWDFAPSDVDVNARLRVSYKLGWF